MWNFTSLNRLLLPNAPLLVALLISCVYIMQVLFISCYFAASFLSLAPGTYGLPWHILPSLVEDDLTCLLTHLKPFRAVTQIAPVKVIESPDLLTSDLVSFSPHPSHLHAASAPLWVLRFWGSDNEASLQTHHTRPFMLCEFI